MSGTQTEDETVDEVKRVTALLVGISEVCEGKKGGDVYAALVYCLGKIIGIANDPAMLLALTIPKIASAAKIECRQLGEDEDFEEAEKDDHSQSTH